MFSKILRGAVLATFVVGATAAQADVFTDPSPGTLYFGSSVFDSGSVRVNVTDTVAGGQGSYGGVGGQFYGSYGSTNVDDFFRFFCIELQQHTTSQATYWRSPLNKSDDEARQLSYLFNTYYPNKGSPGFTFGPTSTYGKFANAVDSGAMQLAVWEIMFEKQEDTGSNGLSLLTGNFRGSQNSSGSTQDDADSQAAVTQANLWLGDIWDHYKTSGTSGWQFFMFESPDPQSTSRAGYQNYIAAQYGAFDVPLPGTLALFGIGLAGLGLARRKNTV